MRRLRGLMLGLLVAVGAAGCDDQLIVENENSPDRDRALARPTDVENLVAGQFRVIHNAWWSVTNLQAQVAMMGMESYSANANFGMNVRSPIPRSLIDNSRGNPADFYGTYLSLNQAARAAALGLSRLNAPDFTFFPASASQTARARAFAYFVKGVALGYLAMIFDSNAVITPDDEPEAYNPLVGYDSVMRAALTDLDSADAITSRFTGSSSFDIPNAAGQLNWMPGPTTLSSGPTGTFGRLIHSYKARFRAGVARNPTERAAVDWAAVRADADAGLTADYSLTMANVGGGWFYRPMQMDLFQSWHQMWASMIGMGDQGANYPTWLNTPRADKQRLWITTADRRFPSGATVAAQRTSSGCGTSTCLQPSSTAPYPYFRHRPSGENVDVDGLAMSSYDFYRFQSLWNANRNGNVVVFSRAELDLLAAESYLRQATPDFASAMARINISRTAAGLPALTSITSLNDPVDGGAATCVPRVPTGATGALQATPITSTCGNIMEALKWEKRLEMAYIYPAGWYVEGRGWGDLPAGTQLQFPVPYTELDSRRIPIYSGTAMDPTTSVSASTYSAADRLQPATGGSTVNYGLGH